MKKYLIRLDDACPTMDKNRWARIEQILDKFNVCPMVGVIPHNEDPKQELNEPDINFWAKVKIWEQKKWAIAMHGYNHCYISNGGYGGINPFWDRSEFAGVPLDKQKEKIREGVSIMRSHNIDPKYFFAPSHTFDDNTLIALEEESNIRIISDTIANKPYRYGKFIMLPQLGGHCVEMKIDGIWTFCLHPSAMKEEQFEQAEAFIKKHSDEFIRFDQIDLYNVGKKNMISKLLSWVYFTKRKLRAL